MESTVLPTTESPWHSHITIDLLARILNRSIFHPFIAWLIPLCLRAISTPYHAPDFIAACAWASFVTILTALGIVNNRVAYGRPREVDWDEEVVVITGGSSGLGKILAQTYGMRGASVAVLDVNVPSETEMVDNEALAAVNFYKCDVSSAEAVGAAKLRIEKDLGPATILINNAGIVHGKPLLSLSTGEVQTSLHVNLLAHFHTIRAFLPAMLSSASSGERPGGTIVTVSSVLGKLGASGLADYTAAKAGLVALHASLRAELASAQAPEGAEFIRTILVTPGQLRTAMFGGVKTPSPFFGPVVEPVELAREIVRMVDAGESGEISLPLYARWIGWMEVLPAGLQRVLRGWSGVDVAMMGFSGRQERIVGGK